MKKALITASKESGLSETLFFGVATATLDALRTGFESDWEKAED
jgi:hypothetical protein